MIKDLDGMAKAQKRGGRGKKLEGRIEKKSSTGAYELRKADPVVVMERSDPV